MKLFFKLGIGPNPKLFNKFDYIFYIKSFFKINSLNVYLIFLYYILND